LKLALQLFPDWPASEVLRSWGGIVDMSMDGSPIVEKIQIDGLYLTAGWCYGGFKATPRVRLVLRPHHRQCYDRRKRTGCNAQLASTAQRCSGARKVAAPERNRSHDRLREDIPVVPAEYRRLRTRVAACVAIQSRQLTIGR
jgi:hypothetical protein